MALTAAKVLLVSLCAAYTAATSFAQAARWQIESAHSTARVSLVSSNGATRPFDLALAMVAGYMNLDESKISQSSLRLSIQPAGQDQLLNPDGTFRKDALANLSSYTLMSFQSKTADATSDHKIEFTGDLTVTHTQRESAAAWSPDYSGAAPTEPVVNTFTREVTFVVDQSNLTVALDRRTQRAEISSLAVVPRQNFPELLAAVRDSTWPPVVLDEECQMPYYPGFDLRAYTGATCTGSLVAATPTSEPPYYVTPNKVGTKVAVPPSGDEIRIVTNLHLQPSASTEPAATHN